MKHVSLFASKTSLRSIVLIIAMLLSNYAMAQYRFFDNQGGITRNICVRDIVQSADGMIWLASERDLYSFDGYHVVKRPIELEGRQVDNVGSYICLEVFGDSLFVGTDRGLFAFSLSSYSFKPSSYIAKHPVKDMFEGDGSLWVATDNAVYRNGKQIIPYVANIISIHLHGKYLYVGTISGLYRYSLADSKMEKMPWGIRVVSSIFSNDDDILWVGTASGLHAWSISNSKRVFFAHMPVVKSIDADKNGYILVGTDDGLYSIDKDYRVNSFTHEAGNETSLAGDVVWSVYKDCKGNMWIGTDNGVSVSNEMMTIYTLPSITGNSRGNRFSCVFYDSKKRLWLGGSNGLLCVEDIGTKAQRHKWYRMNDERYSIPHNRIRSICERSTGAILVGGDSGLMMYSEADEQFVRYRIQEDANNWVYEVKEDTNRLIVVTTLRATYVGRLDGNRRLFNVEKILPQQPLSNNTDSLFSHYDLSQDWLSAYHKADDSLLVVGGVDRFALLDKKQVDNTDNRSYGLKITDIRINGNTYASHEDICNGQLSLSTDDHYIEVYFSEFVFSDNVVRRYMYRFNDGEWLPAHPKDNIIVFADLPSGNNVLQIRCAGNNTVLQTFHFFVAYPWYATTLAKIIYLMVLIFIIYSVWHIKRQKSMIHKEQQKHQQLMESSKQKEQTLMTDNERLAMQLKIQMIDKANESGELSDDERFLAKITKLIEDNMSNAELNVNVLSDISGINTKQLYRRIKAITGMSTVAYIRDMRMKKAASLLSKGTYTVSEVMYIVGYNNLSYFTHCFTEEYKQSPSAYRKTQQEEDVPK